MARKFKAPVAIMLAGMLVYLLSSADFSAAEDTDAGPEEQYADVTISVEALLVSVEADALAETAGAQAVQRLNSVSPEKIMRCVRERDGEVLSSLRLAVGNDSVAEIGTEEIRHEKEKSPEYGTGEHVEVESIVSFRVEAVVRDMDTIMASFDFSRIFVERALSSASEAEEEEDLERKFEVSSGLVLRTGQATVAGAAKDEDQATFLILCADI